MRVQHIMADVGLKAMNRTHHAIVTLTGGRVLGKAFGMPAVELQTVGRKSGKPRSTMLTAPIADDRRIVLVASKGGDERHPDWYRNLVANPDVDVTMAGKRRKMRARTATDEERQEMWGEIVAAYKGYANYQRRTDRTIPVVICEPR